MKNAIRSVNPAVDGPGFYSHFFLVPKYSGGFRPILNLTALNKFVAKRAFRMESNRTVLAAVRTARVASVNRFGGRVFSYRDPHRIPAIFPVRSKRQAVPVYCAPVRTSKRTSCVYPNSGHSSSRATPTSRKATSVSGRLVAKGHSQGGVMSTPPKCVDVISSSRVYAEYGEIVNSPKPRHGFRGNATPHQRRSSLAHTRQRGQIITDYAPASRKSCSYGAPTVC